MTVSLNFNYVQDVMKDYGATIEKQLDPEWKRIASRVMTVALFSLGMLVFLSSHAVGLPAWLVVAALVGWAASVILSAIYMKKLSSKDEQLKIDIELCRIINTTGDPDRAVFEKKFDELKSTVPKVGNEGKILFYCRYIKQELFEKAGHEKRLKELSEGMGKIFANQ